MESKDDEADVDPYDGLSFEEYRKREIEKMKAEGWVVEGEGPPPSSAAPANPGGPPRKPAPPPPPRTSIPGMFSKVEYDTSHMWNADLTQENQEIEENQEEEIKIDFTGTKVAEKYEILEQIGSGVTSVVRRAKLKDSDKEFALKVVTSETNTLGGLGGKNTLKNLKLCQHNHIVKLIDEFQEGDNLYLVIEKLPGTAVNILRKLNKPWTEKDACHVITQILHAVSYVHSKGLIHGDLTPSNILAADDSLSAVKLGGFSKCSTQENEDDLFCEASFKAPEVIDRKKHGQPVDMWGVGCLAFFFLSGKLPFKDNNVMRLNQNIRKGSFTFDAADWEGIDEKAKDFIKGLLSVDPAARLTAAKALEHPWITGGGSDAVSKNFSKNIAQ